MSEHTTHTDNRIEQVDISILFSRALYSLRHIGWAVVVLILVCMAAFWLHTTTSYTSSYTAEATLAVSASESTSGAGASSYANVATAEQMGKVFPYIMSSGILTDRIAEDLGYESVPGSISVEVVENTNLVTIKVTSYDGQIAYDILQSVISNYPDLALYVIGQTNIEVLMDSGIPEVTSSEQVIRGSLW